MSNTFAIGSLGHLVLNLILFALVAVLIVYRKQLAPLSRSRAFMAGTAGLVLGLETVSYAVKLVYPCDPAFERLPLHLCASLKIAITVAILLRRYEVLRYLSVWAIGCGFISFVNLNLGGESFGNFTFWHYVLGHYYLVLAPLFLFLTGELRCDARSHRRSLLGGGLWSLTIFLVNWAFDTNWMYSGPHNTTVVPFLPGWMMEWPMNYVSYVLIAAVMLNGVYALLRFFQARLDGPVQTATIHSAAPALAGVAMK